MLTDLSSIYSRRDMALLYAWELLRIPYEWRDEDFSGMDCSGFFSEVMCACGREPHGTRLTVKLIAGRYPVVETIRPGCAALYGRTVPSHVMLCLNETYVIGSTGGGSSTTNVEAADEVAAFVKVRPLRYRSDLMFIVDPFER